MNMISLFFACTGVMLAPSTARPVKVAVINLPVVSERYQKTADLEQHFAGIREKLSEKRDAMNARLDKLTQSLQEELKPGTEAFDKRQKEIAMQQAELQWFVQSEGKKVEQGLADALLKIYTDIQSTVADIAREQGFDIVLASDEIPKDAPGLPGQVRQHILLQKVVYWSPNVDITDDVVQRLNARYKKQP